jgi:hypothetical protein
MFATTIMWRTFRVADMLTSMPTATLFLSRSGGESPIFDLIFGAVILSLVAIYILWERRYRRAWNQSRARGWRQVMSRFDNGEVVRMLKGRSKVVAGYQVWLAYEYKSEGDQVGIYTLPFSSYEFSSEEEAEKCRKLVANQNIPVRVSDRNPKRSCVLRRGRKTPPYGGLPPSLKCSDME